MLFDLRPNYGGGNDNGDFLQKSHAQSAPLSAPTPQQATSHACLCRILLDTPGQVWVGLLYGHCSFLPGPGAQGSLCSPPESVSQSCLSSGGSMVGLMETSFKKASAIPRSAAPRAPDPAQSTADPHLLRRHPNTVLSQSLWGLWVLVCTRYV